MCEPVVNGPELEVHGLERAKRALHLAESLVAANRIVRAHPILGKAGADHVDAVEYGLSGNLVPVDCEVERGGRLEEPCALVSPPLGELGVATGDQSLGGKVRVGQLEQVTLVEESELQGASLQELANRLGAKRRDPVDAVELSQRVDLLLGDHAAVADQHKAGEAGLLPGP